MYPYQLRPAEQLLWIEPTHGAAIGPYIPTSGEDSHPSKQNKIGSNCYKLKREKAPIKTD